MEQNNTLMFEQLLKAHKKPCDVYCHLPSIQESCEHYNMEYGLGVYCEEMTRKIEEHAKK